MWSRQAHVLTVSVRWHFKEGMFGNWKSNTGNVYKTDWKQQGRLGRGLQRPPSKSGDSRKKDRWETESEGGSPSVPWLPQIPPCWNPGGKVQCGLPHALGKPWRRECPGQPQTHKQQLRTGFVSSHSCLLGHCPRGLSITGLSSHQRRSCCEVTPTLPLATTFHCIP